MQETVKQDRDKYIGGSDIPIIMNLSPFKRRYDLLLEKAKYKNIIKNVVLPKMSEMLSAIRELYGEEVYRDYEELIKENT